MEFLRSAGRHEPLGAEQIAAYRPVVAGMGRPGTLRWRAVRHLISQGMVPTPEQVEAEMARRTTRSRQVSATEARTLAVAAAPTARAYVAAVREATGSGPTWGELAGHLGWSRQQARLAIPHLVTTGHLRTGAGQRSLDLSDSSICV